MSLSGLNKKIISARIAKNLSDKQIDFLYCILRLGSPAESPSGRVSLRTIMTTSLASLAETLVLYEKHGQPDGKLIEYLIESSKRPVRLILSEFTKMTLLSDISLMLDRLSKIDFSKNQSRVHVSRIAIELSNHLDDLDSCISEIVRLIWKTKIIISKEVMELIACEVTACRVGLGGSYEGLVASIENLAGSPSSNDRLEAVSLPANAFFKIVVAVYGTKHLLGLTDYLPDAQQFNIGCEKSASWGSRESVLKEFTEMNTGDPSVVFIQLKLAAVDRQAAVHLARSDVSEVLDQYVAGHRLADLRLSPGTSTLNCDKNSAQNHFANAVGVETARPLTRIWPSSLRESLRMGHLATLGDSPTTKIALTWSALEAAGLDKDLDTVASVLTLQSIRHQIGESYLYLNQGYKHKEKVVNSLVDELEKRVEGAEARLNSSSNELAVKSLSKHLEVLQEKCGELARNLDGHDLIEKEFETINNYAESDGRGYPKSLNAWSDVLHKKVVRGELAASRAQSSFRALQAPLAGTYSGGAVSWQHRLADPETFENWCRDQKIQFLDALNRLYISRNIILHTGIYKSSGQLLVLDSGMAIVDLIHEICGNWSRVCVAYSLEEKAKMKPAEIFAELSLRLTSVIDASMRGAWEKVNFDKLTSPTSSSVDR